MQRKSHNANTLKQLARTYNKKGMNHSDSHAKNELEIALENFNHAVNANPNYTAGYYNRGCIYFKLKQYKKAAEDFTKAIDINPELACVYYQRGLTYEKLGKTEKATIDFTQAFELDPTNIHINEALGLVTPTKTITSQKTTLATHSHSLFGRKRSDDALDQKIALLNYAPFDKCIQDLVQDLYRYQEQLAAIPHFDSRHYKREYFTPEITARYKNAWEVIEREIHCLGILIRLRNNQPIHNWDRWRLLSLPLFKGNQHIIKYPHINNAYEETSEQANKSPALHCKNLFDVYIDSLARNMASFQEKLDDKNYDIVPSVFVAPEIVKSFIYLEDCIRKMIIHLNVLFKIKNNEPISQEEHAHLLSVDMLKQDEGLVNYAKVIAEEEPHRVLSI